MTLASIAGNRRAVPLYALVGVLASLIKSNDMQTVQLGLTTFFQSNATQWPLLMASVILISIPVIVLFLLGQRTFQEGVAAGAVKE